MMPSLRKDTAPPIMAPTVSMSVASPHCREGRCTGWQGKHDGKRKAVLSARASQVSQAHTAGRAGAQRGRVNMTASGRLFCQHQRRKPTLQGGQVHSVAG